MAANIMVPKYANVLSGVSTLGRTSEQSRYRQWRIYPAYVHFPVILLPQDVGFVKEYSGKYTHVHFDGFCNRGRRIISEWVSYLVAGAVSTADYERYLNSLRSWFNTMQGIVSRAQRDNYDDLFADKDWSHFEEAYGSAVNKLSADLQKKIAAARKTYTKELNLTSKSDSQTASEAASEAAFAQSISYYKKLIAAYDGLLAMANDTNVLNIWEATKYAKGDDDIQWSNWSKVLIGNDYKTIAWFRQQLHEKYGKAWARVTAIRAAQAEEKGVEYGETAVTTKMKTGLWSWDEQQQLKMTNAQIQLAAKRVDEFTARMEQARQATSLKETRRLRDVVHVQAQRYMNFTVAKGVRKQPLYVLAVSRYNATLNQVNAKLGEGSTTNWGAVASIVIAGVGGYILLN